MAREIRRLLVANRGEIAARIGRSARAMGVEYVAVASEPDLDALHAREADRVVAIGGASPAESYLRAERILEAAREAGADAIHPGYGFLSENAAFARQVQEAGLLWVGPPPATIEAMGVKTTARRHMEEAGVPVVPGAELPEGDDEAAWLEAARPLGLPLLVKAASGGGGKGMRAVYREEELAGAIGAARREAASAFGDSTVYLERLVERPRHVEVQVLADAHGKVVALGERDCSLQRRHQKLVEESPAPRLPQAVRERMHAAAVEAARSIGYEGAGTVEMLYDGGDEFYFLEMNTRLQVEHPVTELVFGLDLVAWQLRVAQGEALPDDLGADGPRGHAIELRLYAEDPAQGFLPQAGPVLRFEAPVGPGLRTDAGVATGDSVGLHYDPMIAKLCAHGATRDEALSRLREALSRTVLLGLQHNLPYLAAVLATPAFAAGEVHTGFLEEHLAGWSKPVLPAPLDGLARLAASELLAAPPARNGGGGEGPAPLWQQLGPLRLGEAR